MAYVSLEDAKSYVGITDTSDDTEVQRALDSAAQWVDNYTERTFTVSDPEADAATSRVYRPDQGVIGASTSFAVGDLLTIDDLVDVDTVEIQSSVGGSWDAVDAADYELQPLEAATRNEPFTHILWLASQTVFRARVTGWFGWPVTPDPIKEATMLQTSFLYRRRDAPLGISQVPSLEGGIGVDSGMRVRTQGDPNAQAILNLYTRRRVVFA